MNITPHTYILLLTKYYDPHDYIIRRHRRVHRLAQRMLANGYSPLLVVTCCNTARHTHGLELLPAPK